ncbi:MAG TPA: adenosylcobinamide-GDP ribazoletransferase [Candidatus Binataceae bacterium]|nr:adenosylcobinamide-GDP ribazoletransferase [Candidatus Binataceae bacterium]
MNEDGPGAPDRANGAQSPGGKARTGKVTEIRLAAGFLTILPVLPRAGVAPEALAASFGWFPLVGFALGATLAGENLLLTPLFGDALAAVLLVLTLAVLTGAVHVDALADTADALGAGTDRRRALEIMRDSRIGSFGTAAIFFFFALEIVALAAMGETRRAAALWLAPGLARWAMVAVGWRIDYLRAGGAGTMLVGSGGDRNLALACAIAAIAALPILSWRVLLAYAAAAALAAVLRGAYRRWLGGVTGDLLGAAGELVELAVLLVMAVI